MKTLLTLALVFVALFLVGCGGLTKGKAASEVGIDRFHRLFNEGKIEDIWQDAHAKFRDDITHEKYVEFMSAVVGKLGRVTSTSNAGWSVNTHNFTTTVVMTQQTAFEEGDGTETFTFEMDGDKALLVGYHIESMDLITR